MISNAPSTSAMSLSAFRKLVVGASILWTGAVLFSLWIGVENEKRQAVDLAVHEARTNVQTDIGFRRWATSHGGVYVTPDERTPPNPYLQIPNRDVVTTTGERLTLMNPAYMLRQLMQLGYVTKGRITSMKPLNPDNAPDQWEVQALHRLEHGEDQIAEKVLDNGKPAIRLMLPIRVEGGCLKCHGHQGYDLGDLRGGIDVTVPLGPFEKDAAVEIRRLVINHGFFWLLAMSGIGLTWRGGKAHIRRQIIAEEKLLITQFSVDRAEDAIYWLTPDGNYAYVNDTACSLMGYDQEELLRLHVSNLNPHHSSKKWGAHWDELKRRGSLRFEAELRRKDGVMVPVEISGNYIVHGNRELNVAFVRDMREHKAAKIKIAHLTDVYAALSHTNQCIIHSQTRQDLFESIVKIAVDYGHFIMAWVGIVDELTMEIKPTARAGIGADYLDGVTISADPDSPYGQGPSGNCVRSGDYCLAKNFTESTMTIPWQQRAALFGFRSSAAFPLNNQGRTVGALTLYSDETDFFSPELIELLLEMAGDISFALDRMDLEASHRRQEQERQDMVERLTASNTELERFAYVSSHDLQEPLRTIVSFTQLVERQLGEKLLPEERENFGFVVDAAKRMNLLIKDLLAFSRISAKGTSFSCISLATACTAALDNLKEAVTQSSATITVCDLPDVMGDGLQMMQVFQNLIGNAIKFRDLDRPCRITVSADRQGEKWLISVQDNGIGIADTDQDIFEIFRRLHAGSQYPGSGVGLAICKRIITQHGGRIWVDSQLGHGATFRFTLSPCDPLDPSFCPPSQECT